MYHISEDTEHIKYTDIMEIHIVELPKLPQINDGTDLYDWIRFIKAESKGEFEMLAQENNYLKTAYEKLEEISADQEKRLEYTARQKALYDYNTYMEENYERGIAEGIEKGIKKGELAKETAMVIKLYKKGNTPKWISDMLDIPIERVNLIINNIS